MLNGTSQQKITPDKVTVNDFILDNYVSYTPPNTPTRQPSVTITITTTEQNGPQGGSKTTLTTTISSRDYRYVQ